MSKIESPSFGRGNSSTTLMAQAQPFEKRKRGRLPKNTAGVICKPPDVVKAKRGRPPGSKNRPKVKMHVVTHPIVESLKAEINEAVEMQRAHFPNDDELTLRYRAEQFRPERYEKGRWPNFAAVAKQEAAEKAAIEAAEKAAAEAAAARATEHQLPTTTAMTKAQSAGVKRHDPPPANC